MGANIMFDKKEIRKAVESYADGGIDEKGIVSIVRNVIRQLDIMEFDLIRMEVKENESKEDNSDGKSKNRRNWPGI